MYCMWNQTIHVCKASCQRMQSIWLMHAEHLAHEVNEHVGQHVRNYVGQHVREPVGQHIREHVVQHICEPLADMFANMSANTSANMLANIFADTLANTCANMLANTLANSWWHLNPRKDLWIPPSIGMSRMRLTLFGSTKKNDDLGSHIW